jgi:hypothetical protein
MSTISREMVQAATETLHTPDSWARTIAQLAIAEAERQGTDTVTLEVTVTVRERAGGNETEKWKLKEITICGQAQGGPVVVQGGGSVCVTYVNE